jgi:hypothetical protein
MPIAKVRIPQVVHIKKLTSENFATWSQEVKMAFTPCGLWSILSKDKEAAKSTIPCEEKDREAAYEAMEAQAKLSLYTCVSSEYQASILSLSARAAWLHLETLYGKPTQARINQLIVALFTLKTADDEDPEVNLNRALELSSQLTDCDIKLPEPAVCSAMLKTLPDSWNVVVQSLLSSTSATTVDGKVQTLTTDQVRRVVMEEQQRRKPAASLTRGTMNASADGPSTIGGLVGRQPEAYQQGQPWCSFCKRVGHTYAECRSKLKGKKDKKKGKKKGGNQPGRPNSSGTSDKVDKPKADNKSESGKNFKLEAFTLISDRSFSELASQPAKAGLPAIGHCAGNGATFIVDTGADQHMVPYGNWLHGYTPLSPPIAIRQLGKQSLLAVGRGTIKARFRGKQVVLSDVLHIPDAAVHLISVSQLLKDGCSTSPLASSGLKIFGPHGDLLLETSSETGIFRTQELVLDLPHESDQSGYERRTAMVADAKASDLWELYHRRLAHPSAKVQKQVLAAANIDVPEPSDHFCQVCAVTKQHSRPFTGSLDAEVDAVLHTVSADLIGPMRVHSFGGRLYVCTFVDLFSRHAWIYLLRKKSQALDAFKAFVAMVKNEKGKAPTNFASDNGGEFSSQAFRAFCTEQGIKQRFTLPFTPQENGISERFGGVLMRRARSLLVSAGIRDRRYWAEAVQAACTVGNFLPHRALGDSGLSPYQLWHGKPPPISTLRSFGAICYAQIPGDNPGKEQQNGTRCLLMGLMADSAGYRLRVADTNHPRFGQFIGSRSVTFDERPSPSAVEEANEALGQLGVLVVPTDSRPLPAEPQPTTPGPSKEPSAPSAPIDIDDEDDFVPMLNTIFDGDASDADGDLDEDGRPPEVERGLPLPAAPPAAAPDGPARPADEALPPRPVAMQQPQVPESRPKRKYVPTIKALERFALHAGYTSPSDLSPEVALRDPVWRASMERELAALESNSTWVLEIPPKNSVILPSRWVFRAKPVNDGSGSFTAKSRVVAKGFKQLRGVHFSDTYSPTVRKSSIRIFLTLAVHFSMRTLQMDALSAYVQSQIDFDLVYMAPPPGLAHSPGQACRLKRSLYGLRQSARTWHSTISSFLQSIGFAPTKHDACFFCKRLSEAEFALLCLYVDDLALSATSETLLTDTRAKLEGRFKMSSVGPLNRFLGMSLCWSAGGLHLSQPTHIASLVEDCGLTQAKSQSTPIAELPAPRGADEEGADEGVIRHIIGSLLFIATTSRPDIAFATSVLSRHQSNPPARLLSTAKRTVRYLSGTTGLGLTFKRGHPLELIGFCDADHAADPDGRKSTSGSVFFLAGCVISWSSKRQPVVSTSTCESEWYAASTAASEGRYLYGLLLELGIKIAPPLLLYSDSQSVVALSKDGDFYKRMKHVQVRYYFLKDLVTRGELKLDYCPTDEMPADLFTKVLPFAKFGPLRDRLVQDKEGVSR